MITFKKKIFLVATLFFFYFSSSFSDSAHFVDFKKVLNKSKAGSEMQTELRNKFEAASKKFKQQDKKLRKEESDIIVKKKYYLKRNIKKQLKFLEKKLQNFKKIEKKP